MKALDTHVALLEERNLPVGPPLMLERPGRATELLTPFVLSERLARLKAVLARRTRRVTILLEQVHDAHNIAACIRTCDAFGLQDLHIIPPCEKPLRLSKMVSTGAHQWITTHVHDDLELALSALRESGYALAVTDVQEGQRSETPTSIDLERPLCLAFGNERDGASAALRAASDLSLHVPMVGFVDSLNVSVAVAVTVARVRERIDAMDPSAWALDAVEQRVLLDDWIVHSVPHARPVLEEIARRGPTTLSGADGSA